MSGFEFRVCVLVSGFWVSGFGFLGFLDSGLGFRSFGFWVEGFRVWSFGLRVFGFSN